MAGKKIDANLAGTIQDSFAIAGVSITTDADAVKIPSNRFFYDGLGALGAMYANGTESTGTFTFDFAGHGTRQSVEFNTNTTYYIAAGNTVHNGLHMLAITNTSGAALTPVWNYRYDFGPAGPPTIPNGATCFITGLWDAVNVIMYCTHNCAAAGGGGTSDGALTVNFGPELISAAAIIPAQTYTFDIPANYSLSGWQIIVEPAATVSIDVRVAAFPTAPVSGDSITAGHPITTTAAVSNTGTTGAWGTTAIARGDQLQIAITANDVAKRIRVTLLGDKS